MLINGCFNLCNDAMINNQLNYNKDLSITLNPLQETLLSIHDIIGIIN